MKAETTILTFQEFLKKIACDKLVNSVAINFKDNAMVAKGRGVETNGIVDSSFVFDVTFPVKVIEEGQVLIKDLSQLLAGTEIFEKEDLVQLFTTTENKFVIVREIPQAILTIEIADKKYVPSYSEKENVIFEENKITVMQGEKKMEINYTSGVTLDSAVLKTINKAAEKMSVESVPLQITEDKFVSVLKGTDSKLMFQLKHDKINGESVSTYGKDVLNIFKVGFGLAEVNFHNDTPIYIKYKDNEMIANYLLNVPK